MEIVRTDAPTRLPSDLVTCPKCAGKGTVSFYSPYTGRTTYTGTCFDCTGKGTVTRSKREGLKSARLRAGNAAYTFNIVLLALRDGDRERADFYLPAAVADLELCGTANARRVLTEVATGKWYDDHAETSEDTRGTVGPELGAMVCAEAIRIGRERLAAQAGSESKAA